MKTLQENKNTQFKKIVFIDKAIQDYQKLLAGIVPGSEVVILDPTKDGVEQISKYLAQQKAKSVQSVQIISHGGVGSLQLGSNTLNSANLKTYANRLQKWTKALTDDADILLYGCDVASGEGKQFVQQLSQITGADVAASTDKTGSAALGGDWDLEFSSGKIEASLPFQNEVIQTYNSILASAGDVIINEFSQGSGNGREWVELLVVTDNLNLQNHRLVDGNNSLDIRLTGSGFSSLKAGTVIVLYNGGNRDGTITPDLTYNPANGDYVLQISSLNNNGAFAITRTNGWSGLTAAFADNSATDVPRLRNASGTVIYTFPRTPTPNSGRFTAYTGNSATGATVASNWSADAASTSATPGLGNGGNNTTWIEILRGAVSVINTPVVTLNNPSPAASEQFGFSLASDGTNILIGAPGASFRGEAYRLDLNGVVQQTFTNPNLSGVADFFGFSVATNGTNYVIGAPKFSNPDVGRGYRFNASGSLQQTFTNSSTSDDSEFGSAVAILSNGNFVIGAPERDKATANDNAGEVRLFNSSGVLTTIVNPTTGFVQDARFGFSVAAANNDILVGSPGFGNALSSYGIGRAYRYDSAGNQLQTFTNPNATLLDFFGFAVMSNSAGTRFLIGAPGEDIGATNAGAVYLYDTSTPTPTLLRTFTNPDTANLGFGSAVAFVGNDILIGAPGSFTVSETTITPVPGRGAVYLYDGDGASPTYKLEKIFSNPGTGNDGFGGAITAVGPYKIAIGASYYDSGSNTDAGIAYIFNLKNAPVLDNSGNPILTAINETSSSNNGTLVSAIIASGAGGNPITDIDANAVEGIAVIAVDNSNGTWQYSIDNGATWSNFNVTATSATLLRDTASDRIRFVPNPNFNGTANITFRAWDASDGNVSGTTNVNPGSGGDTSAFSIAAETASVTIDTIAPRVSFGAAIYNTTEGSADTTVTIPVTLDKTPVTAVTVPIVINSNSTATLGNDYTFSPTTLNFAAGASGANLTQLVTFTIKPDNLPENAETVVIDVGTLTGAVAGTITQTTINIAANDPIQYAISTATSSLNEGNTGTKPVTFTVTRSGGVGVASTVDYALSGTASFGSDYNNIQITGGGTALSGTLNFAIGETTKTIKVDVLGDNTFELNENITVTLSNANLTTAPENSTITTATATVTINNDDTQPKISVSDVEVTEGDTGTITNANFVVSLSNPSYQQVVVGYSTSDGTASTSDLDYNSGLGTIIFEPGQTSKTVSVGVRGDRKLESNETFSLNLFEPENAVILDSLGVATIKNGLFNELPNISISDVAVIEGNFGLITNANFVVSLSSASSQTVIVNYSTSNGTANVSDSDYYAGLGGVIFEPGETSKTITIGVRGDSQVESNETFFVNLYGPTNAAIADSQAVGTIINDDSSFFPIF